MAQINRREFLAASMATAAVTASFVDRTVAFESGAPPEVQAQPWYDRTMRWVQLILVETDPGQFDPEWWIDLFKRTRADGLCLTAGGLTAFYPTAIPFHHMATTMKAGDDPFGVLVRGARALGMTVVARTDSHTCLNDAAAAHPEWLNIDENGQPRRHPALPETRVITCALGPYNFDFMTQVHREIAERYPIDGLFCNRWQAEARGMCYCDSCQTLFREFSGGMDLPRGANSSSAPRYADFELARLTELWHTWDGTIRKARPSARYFSNTGIDIDVAARLAPTYLSEQQARGSNPPWAFGVGGKQMRTIFGKKPIIGLAGITLSSRVSVAPEAEIKIWMLDSITNGLRPWFLKTSAVNPDTRWVPAIEKVFDWHYRNEKYMRNEANLARVAMLFRPTGDLTAADITAITEGDPSTFVSAASRAAMATRDDMGRGAGTSGAGRGRLGTDAVAGGGGRGRVAAIGRDSAAAGMYQALVEGRIPFEMAYSRMLEPEDIDRYKLLILPNVTALTDDECDKLRQYVGRGGSLLATFETSLYAGTTRRSNFALADLFGVALAGDVESNGNNGYMRVEGRTGHPMLKGLEGVGQIVTTSRRVNVRATTTFPSPPLTRIPSFPTLPMEEIYPRTPNTDIPEVFARTIDDRSRVVYFPGDIDATFATGMAEDLALLIRNAVNWAMNEPPPVSVEGPGILDVTCWRQSNSITVHMLNCTNPFTLRSAYREDIPVGPQRVTIRVPAGRAVRRATLLVAGGTPWVERSGNVLTLTVPSIVDHEVVAIDL
ncbi:MAG TPA: alpha-amylase family protein [Vicinamibacterales bacterium]|nr:alpha-amylase family protein [Vicinamibacterales bacterium]